MSKQSSAPLNLFLLIALFVLLTGLSTLFSFSSRTANADADMASQSRGELMTATYKFHAHTVDMTRLARAFVVTGKTVNYDMWNSLIADGTTEKILETVNLYASADEKIIFSNVLEGFATHRAMEHRAFYYMHMGHEEQAFLLVYGEEFAAVSANMIVSANEVVGMISERTQYELNATLRRAAMYENFSIIAIILLGLSAISGISLMVYKFMKLLEQHKADTDRAQFILDSLPLVITIWDENGNIVDCNAEVMRRHGSIAKSDYLNNFHKFMPEFQPDGTPSKKKATESVTASLATGGSIDWAYLDINGNEIPMEVSSFPMQYQGKSLLLAIGRDMSEVRYRENLLNVVNQSASILLAVDVEDGLESALLQSMELIGRCLKAERTQLWRLTPTLEGVHINPIIQWASETASPQADVPKLIPSGTLPEWDGLLLKIPIILHGDLWGLFTMDDRVNDRTLSISEMDILRSASLMIATAHYRVEQEAIKLMQTKQELEDHWQHINNVNPIGITFWSTDGILVDCNEAAHKMFGVEDKEFFIKNIFSVWPEYQPDGMLSAEKIVKVAKKVLDEGSYRYEWIFQTLDGKPVPIDVISVPVQYGGRTMIACFLQDMRPVMEAMESEREMMKRWQIINNATPIGVNFLSENFELIDSNEVSYKKIFGFSSKEEYKAKMHLTLPEFQPDGTATGDKISKDLQTVLSEGYYRSEWMVKGINGDAIPLDIAAVRLTDEHNETMIATFLQDLRPLRDADARMREAEIELQQQRLEFAQESDRSKTRFLARMSHEIRTPITAVLGVSEIQLRSHNTPPHINEAFAKIHDSANTLLGIVNDILDFSKIESGNMDLMDNEYEVASLVSNATQLRLVYLEHKNITFVLNVDENLPSVLIGDELRIRQIINNLLSNAFKYTPEGYVTLDFGYELVTEDNFILCLSVRDTGFGMTTEQLATLKNSEYKRFHERGRVSVGGTGLGISIVFSLIQMMGATIDMQSEAGVGTYVEVRIPQKMVGDSIIGAETARKLRNFESGTWTAKQFDYDLEPMPHGNVLVVDDVEANIYVAQGLLSFYELNIEAVDNGQAAIDLIKDGKVYDIIFMDQTMPGLSGTETMHILRDMGYHRPVVVLTANAIVGQAEEYLQSGFDGFVSKPIRAEQLHEILVRYIKNEERMDTEHFRQGSDFQDASATQAKLKSMFVKGQLNTADDLNEALESGDIKSAHRLVHTLKSSAALIKETKLSELAKNVEIILLDEAHGSEVKDNLGRSLEDMSIELAAVLDKLSAASRGVVDDRQNEHQNNELNNDKQNNDKQTRIIDIDLYNKLHDLLIENNADCLNLISELNNIPNTEALVEHIENFDFDAALQALEHV